jgi:hypothetical protein
LKIGSPPARGTSVGATCVARLNDLVAFAARS